jgi:hypothetical protein
VNKSTGLGFKMPSFGKFASQNNILLNNVSQCPSEAISNYTVEDKISVLMSNQSSCQPISTVLNLKKGQNVASDNRLKTKKLNQLIKMRILDKSSRSKTNKRSYKVKEHHFMKSLYLHKIKYGEGQKIKSTS